MKTAKHTLSVLLALLMLASCLAIGTSADGNYALSKQEWDSYWETVRNDNTLIALTPGADATQLNFCCTRMIRQKTALFESARVPT